MTNYSTNYESYWANDLRGVAFTSEAGWTNRQTKKLYAPILLFAGHKNSLCYLVRFINL